MQELKDAILIYLQRLAGYDPVVVGVQLLLIGVVVYMVMRFLRGTRGAGLFKGAALVVGVMFVMIRLLPKGEEWQRLEFLYGNFLVVLMLAFLVAFQPEIRRALMSIGQARLFHGRYDQLENMVAELIESARYLSRNRIGAIIAIERSVGLGALTASGTILNARVSGKLLNSLFYPGSPLHDLGVVIRNGRITAAGCQFPMAESDDVDATLGSRHRAALGLSRDSDAVVLVVSEETGRASLAFDGQLYLGLDLDSLDELLLDLFEPQRNRKHRTLKKNKLIR
ncbi:MAG: diadenylate cyclase [Phycisphaerales bacterium]|jgi:diadenylate cyclase|nr:diadenylate cyclase [Phycisphaerales bacterium]MBT7170277.1 diadenylate cyclase [Phycisphaerales bacterium]